MIGKTFSITENKVTRTLKIVDEHLSFGRRFYAVEDSRTPGKPHDFEADPFDIQFKVTASTRFKQRVFTARQRHLK